jgi:hypothetical protein
MGGTATAPSRPLRSCCNATDITSRFFLGKETDRVERRMAKSDPVLDNKQETSQKDPEISKKQPKLIAIVSTISTIPLPFLALPTHSPISLPDASDPQPHILAVRHLTHHVIIDQNTASIPVNAHRAADPRGADAELRGDARCELLRVAGMEVDRAVVVRWAGGDDRVGVSIVMAEDVEAGGWGGLVCPAFGVECGNIEL